MIFDFSLCLVNNIAIWYSNRFLNKFTQLKICVLHSMQRNSMLLLFGEQSLLHKTSRILFRIHNPPNLLSVC